MSHRVFIGDGRSKQIVYDTNERGLLSIAEQIPRTEPYGLSVYASEGTTLSFEVVSGVMERSVAERYTRLSIDLNEREFTSIGRSFSIAGPHGPLSVRSVGIKGLGLRPPSENGCPLRTGLVKIQ